MAEVQEELYALLDNDRLKDASLLIYANKQDLPNAMSAAAVAEKLQLSERQRHRRWHVQGAVAVTGEGLYEGLDWLSDAIRKTTK
jgi:ADP-ribosylation factor protein 1